MSLDRSAVAELIGFVTIGTLLFGPSAHAEGLPPAFNGADLAGWVVPANNHWWTVSDGLLKVESGPERQGSTLWTEREYGNFIVELDFKFGEGTIDSGVFLRNDREQIQIGISGSLKRDMTGSPYLPSKSGYPVEAHGVAELLKADDWNTMTIVAKGKNYTVWLNHGHVLNYNSESAIAKGPVGLQLHKGNEMSISYRNIKIAELE